MVYFNFRNRFFVLLLVFALVFANFYEVPVAHATSYSIDTCTELQAMNDDKDGDYSLIADVDCSASSGWNAGAGFLPIGSAGAMFTGTFDGNGYEISGLYISRSGSNYVGLFSWIDTGSPVADFGLVSPNITGSAFTGAVVSSLKGSVTNVYVTGGSVTGGNYAGGIVGYLNGGTVTTSYASTTVSGSNYVGGLAGYVEAGTLSNSYSFSTVVGSGSYPGGFAGLNMATIQKAYAGGSVTGTNRGGLVGLNIGTITSSFYDGQTTGASDTGKGTSKTTAEMKTQGTFTDWTFTVAGNGTIGTWIMAGYPHLQMEHRTAIDSAVELQLMAINLDGDYTMTGNVNAVAVTNYTPIGTLDVPFTGTFDGNGYMISNLAISQSSLQSAGIFGSTSAAVTITELGYRSGSVIGNRFVGGIVGYNRGAISKSFSAVDVTATTVVASNGEAGGLVGANIDASGVITDSYSTGDVSSTFDVGGLIGYNSGPVTRAYASGDVSGGENLGGLIGRAEVAAITNTFATGAIGAGTSRGGLVGTLAGGSSISGGYWNNTGSPTSCYATGDTGCTAVASSLTYFYEITNAPMSAWNFSTTWLDAYIISPTLLVFGDISAPGVFNVSSDKTNGSYKVGEVIDIDVTFSEAVTSTGNVTVTLETGDTDRTCTFTVTAATSGTCNYTVQASDISGDLTVSSISGTIADGSSNAMSNFVPVTNLAANKALVIDTVTPTVQISSADVISGGSIRSISVPFVVTFSESVVDFDASDISVVNGTAANLQVVTANSVFSFNLLPSGPGSVGVSIGAGIVADLAGNSTTASNSYPFTYIDAGDLFINRGRASSVKKINNSAVGSVDGVASFEDVQNNFAGEAIQRLHAKNIVQGRSKTKYEPDSLLSRAEALKIILLAMNYPLDTDLKNIEKYSDVAKDFWYAKFIGTATKTGIAGGYKNGSFQPDSNVTRAEVLKMLLTTMGPGLKNPKSSPFTDVAAASWYKQFVDYAYILGLVKGRSATVFAPDEFMTRAEIAIMVDRSMLLTDGY
ncbi:MAG: S-layer homology domain-containing protein [Patescibacteria group bacterium]